MVIKIHKVAIIMPAYNEEKRIGSTLDSYSGYFEDLRKKGKLDYSLIVVINNTKDRTLDVVKKKAKENKRINYMNLIKGGKGYAVIEGFKEALKADVSNVPFVSTKKTGIHGLSGYDLIGFVDADGATPAEAFNDLIINIAGYDGAIASRYLQGAKLYPPMNFRRSVVGKTFHAIVRSLFFMPFEDTQCGAKLFSRRATEIAVKNVGMTQWAFDIEMLYEIHRRGLKINEIPTIWREVEGSKLDILKTSLQMLLAIVQLRIIKSKFRRILKPLKHPVLFVWRLMK